MSIAVRNEGAKVNSNINVTPMVDVMLVLLIIFMVITPMLQNKVNIDLAKTDNPVAMPDADKDDAIVVAVTRDGTLYLGQNRINPAEVGAKIRDMLADKPGKQIFVRADARARYLDVENAIDDVRTAGVESVGLLTEKRQPGAIGGE
ncbi:ExbD/TolR family protein [Acidicapsa dinghuensis]|uniref:ExbD/TolR family protein n=1 Tax=Acidicapsa dinghuensis TaxID=2218256 RepID=A0ABW1EA99_9BACT|nr:biopolymer transporter ExbD [Acidicapsa dinghuensis]